MSRSGPEPLVLVTGATGFIGRAVVRRLLAAGRRVVALARERAGEPARQRVARAVGYGPEDDGLVVVSGDLARPASLAAADLAGMAATVETVIHCAGDTTFFPEAPAAFCAGHMDGPRALLERLAAGGLRRWLQVSTAYVCGRRAGTVRESEGDLGQAFHNPYERAKLDAERTVAAVAVANGVDLRIVRPSIVVGPSAETAGGKPSSLFLDFVRLMAGLRQWARGREVPLRIAATPDAPFNIVPLDYVVAAIVTLADHPAAAGGTFHAVVADAPSQKAMLAMVAGRLGVRGPRLVEPGALVAPTALERRVARMLAPYGDYLALDVRFDDTRARAVLDRAEVPPPRLDERAVESLIDRALSGAVPAAGATA